MIPPYRRHARFDRSGQQLKPMGVVQARRIPLG